MIYCVIPPELEDELFAKLDEYYGENPDVTVIVDRRHTSGLREVPAHRAAARDERDRRRQRIPGTFPRIEAP